MKVWSPVEAMRVCEGDRLLATSHGSTPVPHLVTRSCRHGNSGTLWRIESHYEAIVLPRECVVLCALSGVAA